MISFNEQLIRAVGEGNLSQVKNLLGRVRTTNFIADNGHTPLGLAAAKGHLDILRWLVSRGKADINIQDYAGYTPLMRAVEHHQVLIVQELLYYPVTERKAKNSRGISAFTLAVVYGYNDILELLNNVLAAEVKMPSASVPSVPTDVIAPSVPQMRFPAKEVWPEPEPDANPIEHMPAPPSAAPDCHDKPRHTEQPDLHLPHMGGERWERNEIRDAGCVRGCLVKEVLHTPMLHYYVLTKYGKKMTVFPHRCNKKGWVDEP